MSEKFWATYNAKFYHDPVYVSEESGCYPHVRDLLAIVIALKQQTCLPSTLKLLDYGSNLSVWQSVRERVNLDVVDWTIFDPFASNLGSHVQEHPTIVSHLLELEKYDVINFGSVLQYVDDLSKLPLTQLLKKDSVILVTHTPISLGRNSPLRQLNHPELEVYAHSLSSLDNYMKRCGLQRVSRGMLPDSAMNYDCLQPFEIMNLLYA